MNNKKVTVIDTGKEIEGINDDTAHFSDWGKSVPVPIDYSRSYKEVTEVFKFSENVIITNLYISEF